MVFNIKIIKLYRIFCEIDSRIRTVYFHGMNKRLNLKSQHYYWIQQLSEEIQRVWQLKFYNYNNQDKDNSFN